MQQGIIELKRLCELTSLRSHPHVRSFANVVLTYLYKTGRLLQKEEPWSQFVEIRYEQGYVEYLVLNFGSGVCEWEAVTYANGQMTDSELERVFNGILSRPWNQVLADRLVVDVEKEQTALQPIIDAMERGEKNEILFLEAYPGRIEIKTAYGTQPGIPAYVTIPTRRKITFASLQSQIEVLLYTSLGTEKQIYTFAKPQADMEIEINNYFETILTFPGAGKQTLQADGTILISRSLAIMIFGPQPMKRLVQEVGGPLLLLLPLVFGFTEAWHTPVFALGLIALFCAVSWLMVKY
ncbi:MAG: hypothetical protein HQM09_23865 [Candidatus Riflebacteria bacterium]|nr:hypothetical protein [Candidatus Riflebacteria bacterium]